MNDEEFQQDDVPESEAETVESQPVEAPSQPSVAPPGEGEVVDAELVSDMPPPNDPLAVISLVCGILAVILGGCCGLFGLPLALAAIVTGFISLNRIKADPEQYGGHGLALAGVIVGAASIVLALLMFALGIGLSLVTDS